MFFIVLIKIPCHEINIELVATIYGDLSCGGGCFFSFL